MQLDYQAGSTGPASTNIHPVQIPELRARFSALVAVHPAPALHIGMDIITPALGCNNLRRYCLIIRRGLPQHVDDCQLQLIPPE